MYVLLAYKQISQALFSELHDTFHTIARNSPLKGTLQLNNFIYISGHKIRHPFFESLKVAPGIANGCQLVQDTEQD